ncbi:hypothetical protein ABN584_02925 [Gloeocapsa sp. BRSZ]
MSMSILSNFLRSLLLSIILSFIVPMLIIGAVLVSTSIVGYIPGLHGISQAIANQVLVFLATFGSGSPVDGLLVISMTCSLVGALFDTYAFYRYQNLRGE